MLQSAEPTEQLALYRYIRSVKPEKTSRSGIYALPLDQHFYNAVNDLTREICLTDDRNRPLAFTLQKLTAPPETLSEQQLPGRILREQQLPDGRYALDIELENSSGSISSLEIIGGYFPDQARLSIAVGDGRNWQTALDKYPLTGTAKLPESLTRRFPFKQPLPGKFIRLILEKERFTALEAVRIFAAAPLPAPEVPLSRQVEIQELSRRQEQSGTFIISIANNLPLTRLKISANQPFYFCQVNISGSHDRRSWQPIAAGNIRKVDWDVNDIIDFPESRFRFIKINIIPVKGGDLNNPQIAAFANSSQLIFYAPQPAEKFTLYYAPTAPAAVNTPALPAGIDLKNAVNCTAENPLANHLRLRGGHNLDFLNYLIGAALIALAGLAVLIAFAALKRSQHILPED